MLLWLILGVVTGIFIITLTWTAISEWFADNKTVDSAYGQLIKKTLANGNYKVIGGIFNKSGTRTAIQAWETDELDEKINNKFGKSNQIRLKL